MGSFGNDLLYGNNGDDILDGQDNDDQLFGGAGNDSLTGGAGVDLYHFEGTSNSESLQLKYLTATTAQFVRKPLGLTSILELDSIANDDSDEVLVFALGGDDLISIDLTFAMLGTVDGGDGTDTCTAPAGWTKISC